MASGFTINGNTNITSSGRHAFTLTPKNANMVLTGVWAESGSPEIEVDKTNNIFYFTIYGGGITQSGYTSVHVNGYDTSENKATSDMITVNWWIYDCLEDYGGWPSIYYDNTYIELYGETDPDTNITDFGYTTSGPVTVWSSSDINERVNTYSYRRGKKLYIASTNGAYGQLCKINWWITYKGVTKYYTKEFKFYPTNTLHFIGGKGVATPEVVNASGQKVKGYGLWEESLVLDGYANTYRFVPVLPYDVESFSSGNTTITTTLGTITKYSGYFQLYLETNNDGYNKTGTISISVTGSSHTYTKTLSFTQLSYGIQTLNSDMTVGSRQVNVVGFSSPVYSLESTKIGSSNVFTINSSGLITSNASSDIYSGVKYPFKLTVSERNNPSKSLTMYSTFAITRPPVLSYPSEIIVNSAGGQLDYAFSATSISSTSYYPTINSKSSWITQGTSSPYSTTYASAGANTGTTTREGSIVLKARNGSGTWVYKTIPVYQLGTSGSLLTTSTTYVDADKTTCVVGYAANTNVTNLQISSTSSGVTATIDTVNHLINCTFPANTTTSDITRSVTLQGTQNGNTVSSSATIIHRGSTSPLTLTPETTTVPYTGGTVSLSITPTGLDRTKLSVLGSDYPFEIDSCSYNASNKVVIEVPQNNGEQRSRYIGITDGKSAVYANIIQEGVPTGTITISPSTQTVVRTATSATFSVTATNATIDSVSASDFATATYSSGTINVTFPENTTWFDRSSTITVVGTGINGATVTATATLTQKGVQLDISPTSQVIRGNEAQYNVYTKGTTPASISASGNVTITSSSFTYYGVDQLNGCDIYELHLTLAQNDSSDTKVSTITPVATDPTIVSAHSATLSQFPYTGLAVSPDSGNFPEDGGVLEFELSANRLDLSTLSAVLTSSTISNISLAFNTNKDRLIVSCGGTVTNVQTSATITITCDDFYGDTKQVTVSITQDAGTPYISVTPISQTVGHNAGTAYVNIDSMFIISSWSLGSTVGSIDITSATEDRDNDRVIIVFGENPTAAIRSTTVTINGSDSGTGATASAIAVIYQEPGATVSVDPIWKEKTVSETITDPFFEYHIESDGNLLYSGKAYKYPGASAASFTINDVLSNYIKNGVVFENGLTEMPSYAGEFNVVTSTGFRHYQTFYNSWAYQDTDYWLSDPIDYKVSCKQWLPVSFLSTNYTGVTVNGHNYVADKTDRGWTVMTDLSGVATGSTISVTGGNGETRRYQVTDADYVLYYANAYGGWDSLLCNGTSKKTDNIESLNYRRKSHSAIEFSKVDYQKNITPTWSLNTGIIKNGEKMYHLLESTMVYLHDLKSDEIIPVVITNSTCDYLNYTNNGKQPVKYNITVEESNQKMRK